MPRTLYAVSSGSYSDYCVHVCFEQKEDAEEHAKARTRMSTWMDYYVEEMTLVVAGEELNPRPRYWFRKQPDGSEQHETEYEWYGHGYDGPKNGDTVFWVNVLERLKGPEVWAMGYDKEAVRKAVVDKWTPLAARRAGVA